MRQGHPPFRPRTRRDAHQAVILALAAYLPPEARLLSSRGTSWASATFVGARHDLSYTLPEANDVATERLVGQIDDAEFALPGHFVAEIKATIDGLMLAIEALTIEE